MSSVPPTVPDCDQPTAATGRDAAKLREVRYEYSPLFPQLLQQLGASLLVSTYQAGKLGVIGVHQGQLQFSFHHFKQAMGVAISPQRIAVGTRREIYFLHPTPELAAQLEPAGSHDACWLARGGTVTGNIHGHELAWGRDRLWTANTLFSCLSTVGDGFHFVPHWRPSFITELAAEDRCHLNGLAMRNGEPAYVTVLAETNEPAGWRPTKATSGCVIDVATNQVVCRGLAMPHSPRWHEGCLWVLESGRGTIAAVDRASGRWQTIAELPGYTRGLAIVGPLAFVGLSRIRETAVFGGLPIAERRDELQCGVAVVDLRTGRQVAAIQFHSGVEEIFAVELLPNCLNPAVRGPASEEDGHSEVWVVPLPPTAPSNAATLRTSGVATLAKSVTGVATLAKSVGAVQVPSSAAAPTLLASVATDANRLLQQGRVAEALQRLKLATSLAPTRADLVNDLGNAYQALGDQQTALACYRQALQIQPGFVPAHQNLGYLLFNHGEPTQALEHYRAAERFDPQPINRILAATVLPVIYDSLEDVRHWRDRLVRGVHELAESGVRVDTTRMMIPTTFFHAYQGENDAPLARDLARIYQGMSLCEPHRAEEHVTSATSPESAVAAHTSAPRRNPGASTRRVKVGLLSAYFRDHTIGRLNLGRVRHLDRQRFEVTVISAGQHDDAMARAFRQAADQYIVVPRNVEIARRQIAELELDLLLFADVGMDALTATLAYSRMAPVQAVTWGHPDTTGSPVIDYFLSSELLETTEADAHYTERLVRLPTLATCYERPQLSGPTLSHDHFGLDPSRHVYLCPQTLFKFHPEFDAVLAAILERDPRGDLVLIEGRVPNWTDRLRRRFARTLPDAEHRVRFLKPQPQPEFLHLLSLADVVLDPLHFGGGNTSYESLAMGSPVVTWPSAYLRGRITLALYRRMGMEECVVDSAERYVDLAMRLAGDAAYRAEISRAIQESSGRLFDNREELAPLQEFILSALARP